MKTTPMTILMPLPRQDFDPTEVCITWRALVDAGHTVRFATPDGQAAQADPLMISGEGLDAWGWVPGLGRIRLIGLLLRAQAGARQAWRDLQQDPHFQHPWTYAQALAHVQAGPAIHGLFLPGGHAKGMRVYLESPELHRLVAHWFDTVDDTGRHRPVAAVCHGVLLAARSISPRTGRSVLWGRQTTALTWKLEKSAWDLTRWWARFWDPLYYRTYAESKGEPAGYWSVESEVKRALAQNTDFRDVPAGSADHWRKTCGLFRDTFDDDRPAWVVQDGRYLSARWPGDVHTLARAFIRLLQSP